MFKIIKRLTCRHSYMWSERRKQDVCYNCGRVRLASDPVAEPTAMPERQPVDAAVLPEKDPV